MGVFTFAYHSSGGDLEASLDSTFDLQRRLLQALFAVGSSGGVQSSFSLVSPSSAVFQGQLQRDGFSPATSLHNPICIPVFCQVIIGGGGGGAFIEGGAAAPEPSQTDLKKRTRGPMTKIWESLSSINFATFWGFFY